MFNQLWINHLHYLLQKLRNYQKRCCLNCINLQAREDFLNILNQLESGGNHQFVLGTARKVLFIYIHSTRRPGTFKARAYLGSNENFKDALFGHKRTLCRRCVKLAQWRKLIRRFDVKGRSYLSSLEWPFDVISRNDVLRTTLKI